MIIQNCLLRYKIKHDLVNLSDERLAKGRKCFYSERNRWERFSRKCNETFLIKRSSLPPFMRITYVQCVDNAIIISRLTVKVSPRSIERRMKRINFRNDNTSFLNIVRRPISEEESKYNPQNRIAKATIRSKKSFLFT